MQIPNWLFDSIVEHSHAEVLTICCWILFVTSELWNVPGSDDAFMSCRKDKLRNVPSNIAWL
jgi:hypothetical protein